jgi:hypothetical protein
MVLLRMEAGKVNTYNPLTNQRAADVVGRWDGHYLAYIPT